MGSFRIVYRLLASTIWTLVLVVLWGSVDLVLSIARRAPHAWRGWIVRTWARGILWIIGGRLRVTGTAPRAPFLLVANHLSYIDVLVLHSQLRALLVSKAEVGSWPVIGWLARTFGTLFIDRTVRRDVLRVDRLIQDVLDQGDGVVFFPESTTSRGADVQRFKASLLDLPARTQQPVFYAALSYRTPPGALPAETAVCWWGGVGFGAHVVQLLRQPGFEALVTFGAEPVRGTDRKEMAQVLEERVRDLFEPVPDATDRQAETRQVDA